MKKFLLTATILALTAGPALANCGHCDTAQAVEKKVMAMQKSLDLTDDQAAQIKDLMTTKMEAKQAAKDAYMEGLKGVLSEEQMEKYQGMKDEMMEEHHKGSGKMDMKGSH